MARYLPLLLTYINLLSGFAIICACFFVDIEKEDFSYMSCCTLLRMIALIADMLDGRVARKLNATSELGMYLDSLADMVTFGIAPTVYFFSYIHYISQELSMLFVFFLGACCVYICASAYRLARFHVLQAHTDTIPHTYYIGMPITVNGILFPLTLYILSWVSEPNNLVFLSGIAIYMCVSAYLMVSTIRFPKL